MDLKHAERVASLSLELRPQHQAPLSKSTDTTRYNSSDTLNELAKDHDDPYERFQPTITQNNRSTAFLDGLRGLAALCVFIQHYIPGFDWQVHEHGFGQLSEDGTTRFYYTAGLPFVRIFFNGGNAAVAIFFVLSGYVLSKAPVRLLRDGQREACYTSLTSALIRRPARLYLPILAVTFLTAICIHVPGPMLEWPTWMPPEPTVAAEIQRWWRITITFLNPFQEHSSSKMQYFYNAVAWTLPIELKGSVFVYALLALFAVDGGKPGRSAMYLFFFAGLLLQLAWWSWACFVFGLVLAIVDVYGLDTRFFDESLTPFAQNLFTNACFWVGWYLLSQPAVAGKPVYSLNTPGWGTLTRMAPRTYSMDHYYRYWQSWGGILLVYACLRLKWLQNVLHTRPLRYLGKVSFMLYLVHLPFFKVFGDRLSRAIVGTLPAGMEEPKHDTWYDRLIAIPEIGPVGMNTRFILCMAINLPVTLIVAHAATVWIDMPTVRLGKKITRKLGLESNAQDERKDVKLPQWAHQRSNRE